VRGGRQAALRRLVPVIQPAIAVVIFLALVSGHAAITPALLVGCVVGYLFA